MAEWSKAVLSGSILHWRRFESCCYYPFLNVGDDVVHLQMKIFLLRLS